ncbi:MAG: hypothetical protein GY803_08070 [Chloroflexi bacterium]|nr:hypothetical protein [Chloroflexota bacterium]
MTNYNTIERLVERANKFETLTPNQQAGFRAALTRQLNSIEDDEMKAVLEAVQEHIGEPEKRATEKLTADDLINKYPDYLGMSPKQRGAYKAQISRLLNTAVENGDSETVKKLESLKSTMEEDTLKFQKHRILAQLENLKDNA